jgi:hypothetical protein
MAEDMTARSIEITNAAAATTRTMRWRSFMQAILAASDRHFGARRRELGAQR